MPTTPRSDKSQSTPQTDKSQSTPRTDKSPSTPRSDKSPSTPRPNQSPSTPRPNQSPSPSRRGTATVVATVALSAITVGLAVTVVVAVPTDAAPPEPKPAALSLSVVGDEIRLTHHGGLTLDVDDLRVRVTVDGEALAHQPPVPFFAATGFEPGPTGPFNVAAAQDWRAGEVAAIALASTNDPGIGPGSTVRVRIWAEGSLVADLTATASVSG